MSVSSVVFDASALLAVLLEEPGSELVVPHLNDAALSTVNYSEVLKKAVEKGGTLKEAASAVHGLQLDIVPFDESRAVDAARLFVSTRHKGISFADRACLSLAIELGVPLYTADKRLAEIDAPVRAFLIREPAGGRSEDPATGVLR